MASGVTMFAESREQRAESREPYYLLTDEESERLNILKLWFSIMVVMIHAPSGGSTFRGETLSFNVPVWLETLKYFLSQAISRCAVPGFFFMSAIFLYRNPFSWKANIKKKVKTLVIPYFILNTFWIAFYYCCEQIPSLSLYFTGQDFANWVLTKWLDAYIVHVFVGVLWFLRDLFVLNLLATFIMKILDRFPKVFPAILLVTWLCVPDDAIYTSSFCELKAICFWVLGCSFVRERIKLNVFDKIPSVIHWVLYLTLIAVDTLSRETSWNLPVHRFCSLYGIVFWYTCMTRFKAGELKNFLLKISSFSFCIYIFHFHFLYYTQKILSRFCIPTPVFQLCLYIVVPIFVIMFCVVVSMMLKKYFPKTFSVITGSRL